MLNKILTVLRIVAIGLIILAILNFLLHWGIVEKIIFIYPLFFVLYLAAFIIGIFMRAKQNKGPPVVPKE